VKHAGLAAIALMASCTSSPSGPVDGGGDAEEPSDAAVSDDADSDAAKDAAVTPACAGPVSEPTLCLGQASGHPGDRVSLEVYIVLPAGCASTTQVGTHIVPAAPVASFVERGLMKPACWSMNDDQGTGSFFFATASAVGPGCPVGLSPGRLVTIELDVTPGAAAGTYELRLEDTNLGDDQAACRGGGKISGALTVLP